MDANLLGVVAGEPDGLFEVPISPISSTHAGGVDENTPLNGAGNTPFLRQDLINLSYFAISKGQALATIALSVGYGFLADYLVKNPDDGDNGTNVYWGISSGFYAGGLYALKVVSHKDYRHDYDFACHVMLPWGGFLGAGLLVGLFSSFM